MEFTINKEDFLKGLYKAQNVVDTRNIKPILAYVLIESEENSIKLTATDLEVGLIDYCPANIIKKGKITLLAKRLFEIVKEMPEVNISIKEIENSWVEIESAEVKFKLMGFPPEDFPTVIQTESEDYIELPVNSLKEMIDKTYFATSTEESRYNLNGIFFQNVQDEEGNKFRMVAADGRRMAMIDKPNVGKNLEILLSGVTIPKKGFAELKKFISEFDEPIKIGFSENDVIVKIGKTYLVIRLMEGEFPDYQRVIPKTNDKVIKVNRKRFLEAMKRMLILINDRFKSVKFEINQQEMIVSTNNPDIGEVTDKIAINYNGDNLTIGFNGRYILDVLNVLSCEEVEIALKDETSAAIFRPVEEKPYFTYVVMPVHL